MSTPIRRLGHGFFWFVMFTLVPMAAADDKLPPPDDFKLLAGDWLLDSAQLGEQSRLRMFWNSKLTIADNAFSLTKLMDHPKDLTGKFTFNPAANPKTVDLTFNELDFAELDGPFKIPAMTLPGIYKFDGDLLTICFYLDPARPRPADFTPKGQTAAVLRFGRVKNSAKEFPKDVVITVKDPEGKSVAGVPVFGNTYRSDAKANFREWQYLESSKTDADGAVRLAYEKFGYAAVCARDIARSLVGVTAVSPYSLQSGRATVALTRQCRLSGSIVCEEVKKLGRRMDFTNVILMYHGERIAQCDSFHDGVFEFFVPPGEYALHAYGTELRGRTTHATVSEQRPEMVLEPIKLEGSKLLLMMGQPAPELDAIVGWKGKPVKFADLKGKLVLVEFWGYWCGPCVGSMPVLIELHEKFHDKGLAIVGVHLDVDGEVDTAAKLDAKIATFKKSIWQGKDLPFPSALTSGKRIEDGEGQPIRGGPAAQYGVLGYPTTILIDREGKVVGKFHARDAKTAIAEMETLLAGKK